MAVTFRGLCAGEARAFYDMMEALDGETGFMMYEPGERRERTKSLAPIEGLIERAMTGGDLLIAAVDGDEIVGYISAQRGGPNRVKHTAYIVTGIRADWRGMGIGTEFFRRLDEWAHSNGVTRLELTVMEKNAVAKRLYEKSGFTVEGVKRASMLVDGKYEDEYYMAKLL